MTLNHAILVVTHLDRPYRPRTVRRAVALLAKLWERDDRRAHPESWETA